MRLTRRLPFHPFIVSMCGVALSAATAWAGPGVEDAASLLKPAGAAAVTEAPSVIRSRGVEIDAAARGAIESGRPIRFNLFDDVAVVASLRSMATAGAWNGSIEGVPHGSVTLVTRGDNVAASIRVPGTGTFRIRPVENGLHIVEHVDEDAQLPCGFGAQHAIRIENAADPAAGGAIAAGGGPVVVDVMVVYTPAARSSSGGTAAMESLIDLFLAETNTAYQNSLINLQVNLVHTEEITYDESQNHLNALTGQGDGVMDEVHALRYVHQADLVALLVNSAGYCGVAWLMPANDVGSQDLGFSVTVWPCGGLVFAHELGHNMGCCHAPGDGGGCTTGGLFSYSVGYRYNGQSGQLWRTVMAYSPGTRITNFSNPGVLFDNQPTGVSVGQPNEADNSLTIGQTTPTIAMYRTGLPFCENDKYLAGDGQAGDFFGFAADLEGNVAIVGAPFDGGAASVGGAAYAFSYDPGTRVWSEEQEILGSDTMSSDSFGSTIALSGDVVVIGAEGADDNGSASGAAYVFRYDDNSSQWLEEVKLTASDAAAGDNFGSGVGLGGDVIVVGASGNGDNGEDAGAAYVFRYNDGTGQWDEEATLTAFDGVAGQQLGQSAVVRGDLIIVGAPGPSIGGAAYVYRYNGATWDDDGKLEDLPLDVGAQFGSSMAISGDALIVGAAGFSGSATIFREVGGVWSEEDGLSAPGLSNSAFGTSVDIAGDKAIVGAPFDDDFGSASGAAFVYRFDGVDWVDLGKMMPFGNDEFHFVGYAVGIEGIRSIVGASGDSTSGGSAGAFHAFNGFTGTDCNGNGTADDCEILDGDATDNNGNGVPDECDVPGDVDGDGVVGINDFLLLLGAWGPCGDCGACPADLDGDCSVGIQDFLDLLAAWDS